MNDLSFLDKITGQRILVAPLHWGLGHATRCIPIIKKLSKNNAILLGSDGLALDLLKREFPHMSYVKLPSYNIHYKSDHFLLGLVKQGPKLTLAVSKEMAMTEELVNRFGLTMIISDHRFGCRDIRIRSVIIAHQLQLQAGIKAAAFMGSKLNKFFINDFDECWIPDYKVSELSLSGVLSRSEGIKTVRYIGPISRLSKRVQPLKYDVAVILSGPEPKRTWLETALNSVLKDSRYHIAWIRGTTAKVKTPPRYQEVIEIATSDQISRIFNQSKVVIARAGYTTVMDISHVGVPSILIPTKGQPEQEHLALHLEGRDGFDFINEDQLSQLPIIISKILND